MEVQRTLNRQKYMEKNNKGKSYIIPDFTK